MITPVPVPAPVPSGHTPDAVPTRPVPSPSPRRDQALWKKRATMLPNAVLSERGLSAEDKVVYTALASFVFPSADGAEETRTCHPSRDTLASCTALTVRTVGRCLDRLVAHGWLIKTQRAGYRAGSLYQLTGPRYVPLLPLPAGSGPSPAASPTVPDASSTRVNLSLVEQNRTGESETTRVNTSLVTGATGVTPSLVDVPTRVNTSLVEEHTPPPEPSPTRVNLSSEEDYVGTPPGTKGYVDSKSNGMGGGGTQQVSLPREAVPPQPSPPPPRQTETQQEVPRGRSPKTPGAGETPARTIARRILGARNQPITPTFLDPLEERVRAFIVEPYAGHPSSVTAAKVLSCITYLLSKPYFADTNHLTPERIGEDLGPWLAKGCPAVFVASPPRPRAGQQAPSRGVTVAETITPVCACGKKEWEKHDPACRKGGWVRSDHLVPAGQDWKRVRPASTPGGAPR